MTVVQLNEALVSECTRLNGDQARVLAVMNQEPFGVVSVNDLPAEKYQPLIDAIKALV